MWNDTDIPLAYLITFRTYGSWLHGDERGSVNRYRNVFGTTDLPPNKDWLRVNQEKLKQKSVELNAFQRQCVETAIRETCDLKNWGLLGVNVRTNHVHIVVKASDKKSGTVLNAFKSNATRCLREKGLWKSANSPWSDKGSQRFLWNESSIEKAIDYVVNGQGGELPKL